MSTSAGTYTTASLTLDACRAPGLDGRFRIVQFTDTHFCDGSARDRRTASLLERVLVAERPDLVVLTGDVIDGARAGDPAAAWRQTAAPMIELSAKPARCAPESTW
jgi:predicted MPP superfamily phosphohydrolase